MSPRVYTIPMPDETSKEHQRGAPEAAAFVPGAAVNMPCCRFRWTWLLDFLIAVSVLAGLVLIEYGFIPCIKTGFYCKDPKISHKFQGDTISLTVLLLVTVVAPFLGLWAVEWSCFTLEEYSIKHRGVRGMHQALRWYWEFFVGFIIVLVVTETAKALVGEPRPHFLDTCKPDLALNCTSGYVSADYVCTNKDEKKRWLILDSNKSFPSGHAAISTYMSLFMMWFIQQRVPDNATYLLVPWLHCICLVWALVCSLTRITDHRHHWWDVLAGICIGIGVAVFIVSSFCGGFNRGLAQSATRIPKCNNSNGHIVTNNGGNRHQSVRRLLSSTSSYTSSIMPEERELSEVAMT